MKFVRHLINAQQAHTAMESAWRAAKPWLMAGHRLELEVRPERRGTAANALLHALLQEVADQKEWAGKKRSVEVWKRLLTAAWLRARGESVEILPALDGHGVDVVFRRTSEMTKSEFAELVDFVTAWCAENGIEFAEMAA